MDVTVDDGDDIVLLENFGGLLLQFKRETLYIIDVTSEPEFLRETHKYRGIPTQSAAARTDFGIIFANKSGAYLFNGEDIKQLCAGKIEDEWADFYSDSVCVGYHPRFNIGIFVNETADFLIYDILSDSWVEGAGHTGGVDDGFRIGAVDKSQFFVYENELILAQESTGGTANFYKWNEDYSTVTTAQEADYSWVSKDLDLGNPATLKRISKVKITYKTTDTAPGNAMAKLLHNDGAGTTSTDLSSSGTDFADTSGDWATQDFTPDSTVKCYSTKVSIANDGVLDKGFEINDITVIYRERPVK